MPLNPLQIRLIIQLRIHIPGTDGIAPDAKRGPLRSQALAQLYHGRLGRVVGALFLRVEHADAGDGAEEDYAADAVTGCRIRGGGGRCWSRRVEVGT